MTSCTLCDLSTPDPPVTDEGVEGEFCCEGCLEVYRTLGDVDPEEVEAEDVLEKETKDVENAETDFVGVEGMHCATCELFIESRTMKNEGVVKAEASYASEMAKISYDSDRLDTDNIIEIVSGTGYKAYDLSDKREDESFSDLLNLFRLFAGFQIGMMVMLWYVLMIYPRYLGIGPVIDWGAISGSELTSFYLFVMTSGVLFFTGFPILRSAYVSLRSGTPNMDLLIALAAVNAYVYSTAVAFTGGKDVYFDIAVMIVLVVTAGNEYEKRVKNKASGLLGQLNEERVDTAKRKTKDGVEEVSVERLDTGDEVVVKQGERVPIDGEVIEGTASMDESLLTGESIPERKEVGDEVIGGSTVADGRIVVEVPKDKESTLDTLVKLLWDAQSSRSGVQRVVDKLASVFIPLVLVLAAGAFSLRFVTGTGFTEAFLTGLAVLVVSCPCALGLATPLAVASGIRNSLKQGVIITSPTVFEEASDCGVIAFDKTGTLTTGEMKVIDEASEEAMEKASAVESYSSHPVAEAITSKHESDKEVEEFEQHPGRGVTGYVDGEEIVVGNADLFDERDWKVSSEIQTQIEDAQESGDIPVIIGWNGEAKSVAVVGDEPRDGWWEAVDELAQNRKIAVITGDSRVAARKFEEHPGIDHVFAEVRPEAKSEVIERLKKEAKTAMVGDGSNDAPALASADLGIALGGGTAIAADAADVVVSTDDLGDIKKVFELTKATKRRIRQNLGWALVYNSIAIPAAVLGLINPLVAAVAMAISSILVVLNSTRSLDGYTEKISTEISKSTTSKTKAAES